MRIRDGDSSDPGRKKVGSGINIPDPQHWGMVALYLRGGAAWPAAAAA